MIVSSRQAGHRRGRRSKGTTPDRCCLSSRAVRYRESRLFDLVTGLHPPGKSQFQTKKEYRLLPVRRPLPLLTTLAGKCSIIGVDSFDREYTRSASGLATPVS